MSTGEAAAKADTASTANGEYVEKPEATTAGVTDQRRTISREQRSAAAKRGWVTRKKRKP